MSLVYGGPLACDEAQIEARSYRAPCPQRDKPWVLTAAILGSSLIFIEGSIVNLALPSIQADFAATSTELQWVVNAYLLVLGSLMLTGGSLGDRYGMRRMFLLGTFIFGIASFVCAFAPSLLVMIGLRIVQGIGGALLVPASLALISNHFDEHERGRAIGTWAGASALTTAIGPVLGGWLVDQWGWPAVFLMVAPLAAVTCAIAWWRVPASTARGAERLDYPGGLLLTASLGLLIFALVNPGSLVVRLALLVVAVLLGLAFVWREARTHAPMLPLLLFRSRSFSGANLMTLLLYCALSGALYFLPFNLIQVQGYSAAAAGAAFLPFTVIMGFGSTLAGGLIRKFNPRVILTVGPAVTALGFFALAIPGTDADFLTGFLPAIVVIGIGMTVSVTPLTTVVMSSVSEQQAGTASGVNNTAARLAGVVAVAALTVVAVQSFTNELGPGLTREHVPSDVASRLLADASALAELKPPPGSSPDLEAAVELAIGQAYVAAFRLVVSICGILAILSSVVAWLLIADRVAGRTTEAVAGGTAGDRGVTTDDTGDG